MDSGSNISASVWILQENVNKGQYQNPKAVVSSSAAGASDATQVQPKLQHSAADGAPRQHQHVAGASAATLMQLRLQRSATDSAPGQHQCVPDQARPFDDITAGAKATSMKIEELSNCLVNESSVAQLKRIKNCTDTPKRQNRDVA